MVKGSSGGNRLLKYAAVNSDNAANQGENAEDFFSGEERFVTISHTTFLLVESQIECEPKGQIEVKGFTEPVKIYEVVGEMSRNDSQD